MFNLINLNRPFINSTLRMVTALFFEGSSSKHVQRVIICNFFSVSSGQQE